MPCRFSGSAAEWHWASFSTLSSGHKDPLWAAYICYTVIDCIISELDIHLFTVIISVGLYMHSRSQIHVQARLIATKLDLVCRACFITAHFERGSGCLVIDAPKNQIYPYKFLMTVIFCSFPQMLFRLYMTIITSLHKQPFITAHFQSSLHLLCITARKTSPAGL